MNESLAETRFLQHVKAYPFKFLKTSIIFTLFEKLYSPFIKLKPSLPVAKSLF